MYITTVIKEATAIFPWRLNDLPVLWLIKDITCDLPENMEHISDLGSQFPFVLQTAVV